MNILNKISQVIALSGLVCINVATAAVDYTGQTLIFNAQTADTLSVTYTNNTDSNIDSALGFATQVANSAYALDSSNCTTLAIAASCNVYVTYTPTDGKQAALFTVTNPNDNSVIPLFASNYFDEKSEQQAARRLMPTVEKVEFFDSGTPVDGNLIGGVEYIMRLTLLAYDDINITTNLFNCNAVAPLTDCASSTDSQHTFFESGLVSATKVLTGPEISTEGLEVYSYQGQQALHQQFDLTFTLSTDSDGVALEDGSDNQLGFRVWYVSQADNTLGVTEPVSTLFAGGLNIQGQGDDAYLSTDSRRVLIKATKQMTP